MKNISNIMAIFCLFLSLCSCEDEVNLSVDSSMTSTNPHAISMEQALASLQDFMAAPSAGSTRAAKDDRRIGDVYAVEYKQNILTRSSHVLNPDVENLVYIANFEDNQGFAILAADDRIETGVIAVTDSGSLKRKHVDDAYIALTLDQRPLFKNYPLAGPGFFQDEEYPDETQINPNTVNLYDIEEGDTLVGDFVFDDGDNILGTLTNEGSSDWDTSGGPSFISHLALSYALDNLEPRVIDGGGNTGGPSRTETIVSDWAITKEIRPILSAYSSWDQSSPFNDNYPWKKKRKKKTIRAHAGCFPLAIAKIMTHFSFPPNMRDEYGNIIVNWGELRKSALVGEGRISAANLLYSVSTACHSKYFYNGTFTFPFRAVRALKDYRFSNVDKCHYEDTKVLSMLENGYPLLICAMPGIHITQSHAWNIDGYKRYKRTITTKTYNGNILKNESQNIETYNMVHCDFGWGGNGNGYFISGIFNFKNKDNEFDGYNNHTTNYNKRIRLITYRKP